MGTYPMTTPDNCPECGVTLQGEEIPEDIRPNYSGTHWNRVLGVKVQGAYDGVLFWQCPDCGARWHRWDRTSPYRSRAETYVSGERS